ncbi:MAG: hypothetical protein M2R45_02938 [Verrucomicrobia subdivision 3 bacterium]|nr:hypothetical protein [Limisphaerales bacterium]MCS1415341.1 hypothetical protein [Limisphaerales bacterium]
MFRLVGEGDVGPNYLLRTVVERDRQFQLLYRNKKIIAVEAYYLFVEALKVSACRTLICGSSF